MRLKAVCLKIFPAVFFLLLILSSKPGFAQNSPSVTRQILNSINTYTKAAAIEKLYIQTDKPGYGVGDTLWFKGYLLNAADLTVYNKTEILYLEITDESNTVIRRSMVTVYAGLCWGYIDLNEKEFPQGFYTLRAYTNWMRNYDEHYIFKKQFSVTNSNNADSWFINSQVNLTQQGDKPSVKMNLDFKNLQQQQIIAKDVELALTEGRKTWFKNKFITGVDGMLDFNFQLPEKANTSKLAIRIKELKKDGTGAQYVVPVIFNRKERTDLQFMPEGGALVAGIDTKVAFKAIGEDGNAADIDGTVYNSKQQVVAKFKSTHLGMGSFYLKPQAGETYTAMVKLDEKNTKSYNLPAVKKSGMVMNVVNNLKSDSIAITLAATPDISASNDIYYLVGQIRGAACYGSTLKLEHSTKRIAIHKNIFPTGVVSFTLFNAHVQPLNERMVFIDQHDRLCITAVSHKITYTTRDSVRMDITVTDKTGAPVQGVLSLAVTDDHQVKVDSVHQSSLLSTMLLTSDIKGEVSDPGYYFQAATTEEISRDLDNLLLTQGWVNYNWPAVFSGMQQAKYQFEPSFSIKGKVTNMFNKAVAAAPIVMLSKKPAMFKDTLTNTAGEFTFTNIYPADTAAYVIQARNKRGKSFNVGIEVQEFSPPNFNAPTQRLIPNYVNMDNAVLNATHNQLAYKTQQAEMLGMHSLKEVVITDKKVIKDSKNLNGDGGSDFAMNEADMEKARKTSLGELLKKNVPGFSERINYYVVRSEYLVLIMDGINVLKNRGGASSQKELYDQSFDYYTAEDIKGIEVMHPGRFGGSYFQEYIANPMDDPNKYCFIEITTRSGHGPFYKSTPGVYVYKPMPFIVAKEFYSPKYKPQSKTVFADIRSTIYWAPNVITGKDGKAQVSFYTADKPGTYTVALEGTDMQGNLESTRTKIIVK